MIDGKDLSPVLFETGKSNMELMFYYRDTKLTAVRKGHWKAHFVTQSGYRKDRKEHDPPALYHLEHDPSEKFDVAEKHPDVIADIRAEVERHRASLKPVPLQLEINE